MIWLKQHPTFHHRVHVESIWQQQGQASFWSSSPWDADVLEINVSPSTSAIRQGGIRCCAACLVKCGCSMNKEDASKTCYRGINDVAEAVQTAKESNKNLKRREACSNEAFNEGIDQRQL